MTLAVFVIDDEQLNRCRKTNVNRTEVCDDETVVFVHVAQPCADCVNHTLLAGGVDDSRADATECDPPHVAIDRGPLGVLVCIASQFPCGRGD